MRRRYIADGTAPVRPLSQAYHKEVAPRGIGRWAALAGDNETSRKSKLKRAMQGAASAGQVTPVTRATTADAVTEIQRIAPKPVITSTSVTSLWVRAAGSRKQPSLSRTRMKSKAELAEDHMLSEQWWKETVHVFDGDFAKPDEDRPKLVDTVLGL